MYVHGMYVHGRCMLNMHQLGVIFKPARCVGGFGRVLEYVQDLEVLDRAGTLLLLIQSLPSLAHRKVIR